MFRSHGKAAWPQGSRAPQFAGPDLRLRPSRPRGRVREACAAVVESLEQRTMLSLTVNHEPYLQLGNAPLVNSTAYTGKDQAQVIWQTVPGTGLATSFTIEHKKTADSTWSAPYTLADPGDTIDTGVGSRKNWFRTLTNLDFNTSYDYRVRHYKGGVLQTTYQSTFVTRLAAADSTNFSFAAYGDSARVTNLPKFRDVVSAIGRSGAAFSLLLGDNAYDNGTHAELDMRLDPAAGGAGYSVSQHIRKHIEYPAYGNHDAFYAATNGGQATEHNYATPIPVAGTNVPAGIPTADLNAADAEHNYSFDYGNAHFLSFDSNYCSVVADGACFNDTAELDDLLDYAVADLNASSQPWKIVFFHHPLASLGDHTALTNTTYYYQQVVSRLRGAGADLVLTGHAHNYQRSYPLLATGSPLWVTDNDNVYSANATQGLAHLVVGVGGTPLDDNDVVANGSNFVAVGYPKSTAAADQADYGFAKVDVRSDHLLVSYISAQTGKVLDRYIVGADKAAPEAKLTLDGGGTDLDRAEGKVLVSSTQSSITVTVDDVLGEALDTTSVTAGTLSLTKDGAPQTFSFAFSGTASGGTITLTPSGGGSWGRGVYRLALNGGANKIDDTAGNQSAATTLVFEIDTLIPGTPTTTVSFQDGVGGYDSTVDTYIAQGSGTSQAGAQTLFVDGYNTASQILLRFNSIIGAGTGLIPANAALTLATLQMYATDPGNDPSIYAMLQSWADTNVWGSFPSSLGDGVQTGNETAAVPDYKSDRDVKSITPPQRTFTVTQTVQGWVNNAASNHGWAFVDGGDNGYQLSSSEHATVSQRPKLTATYETVRWTFVSGALQIIGTRGDDTITVSASGGNVTLNGTALSPTVAASAVTSIEVIARAGNDTVNLSGVSAANGFNTANLSGQVTVRGEAGNDTLTAVGFGAPFQLGDWLYGGEGDDTVQGNQGYDLIFGGPGADSLSGGDNTDEISGEDGNDTIDGQNGNDWVFGNAGDDLVKGGADHDAVYGGDGSDLLQGDAGDDRLRGGNQGDSANDGADQFSGGTGTDLADYSWRSYNFSLSIDGVANDGVSGEGDNILTDVENVTGGSGNDSITGSSVANVLKGGPGNDIMSGGAGNDTMLGEDGHETMFGGAGNDSMEGNAGTDWIFGDDDHDTIRGGADHDYAYGGYGNDFVFGEGGNDWMRGGTLWISSLDGTDYLDGGDGADTMFGGDESDQLNGDVGNDVIRGEDGSDTAYAGPGDDLVFGGNAGDGLYGEDGNDWIFGDAGNDYITAGADHDVVYGGSGNDLIGGDEGNDHLHGGEQVDIGSDGADTLWGGSGTDRADYTVRTQNLNLSIDGLANDGAAFEGDNIQTDVEDIYSGLGNDVITGSAVANHLRGGVGGDIINAGSGNDTVVGNDGSDTMTGGNGFDSMTGDAGDDYLWGNDDNDTISGGADHDHAYGGYGNDVVYGDDGNDWLRGGAIEHTSVDGNDYVSGGNGNDTAFGGSDDDMVLGDAGADQLFGDEGADYVYGGTGDDFIRGGLADDVLYGEDGNDWFFADAGNDLVLGGADHDVAYGGTGNDQLYGEDGNDHLHGGDQLAQADGADTMSGGLGTDRADYQFETQPITVTLDNVANDGRAGEGDNVLDDIEEVYGGFGNDAIYGSSAANYIWGNSGHDYIEGQDGNDTIDAGSGDDYVYGGLGDDDIDGQEGHDTVYGDAYGGSASDGDDTLTGGTGTDVLDGQGGDDSFFTKLDGYIDYLFGGTGFDWADADSFDVLNSIP